MTVKQFFQKLRPYFTFDEVCILDSYALECAQDSHDGLNLPKVYLQHIGRDFVIDLIGDMSGDCDPYESITGISGTMSIDGYNRLIADIDSGVY